MIGIDEVGRGCWAGPLLVVAARRTGRLPKGLTDSKLLTALQREKLYQALEGTCQFGEGWVTPPEIDAAGLTAAMRLGVQRALVAINAEASEQIIMDGLINYADPAFVSVHCRVKADLSVPLVSAASIYAKVTRDRYMRSLSEYPQYGFDKHVGYGTALHRAMLELHGLTPLHRRSFKPLNLYGDA
jgi:ribonuclease HII